MRVILEKGDKPEVKELVRQLQKLVPGIVIIEDETQQEHWLLSDDEIREAILSVMPFFSVKSQWVALSHIGRLLWFPRRGGCFLQQDQ